MWPVRWPALSISAQWKSAGIIMDMSHRKLREKTRKADYARTSRVFPTSDIPLAVNTFTAISQCSFILYYPYLGTLSLH